MNFFSKKLIIFFIFFLFFFFSTAPVLAASIFFDSDNGEVSSGQTFKVDLLVNMEGININAIEGKVFFPADILELKQTIESGSIVSFWIKNPQEESSGEVLFSGGFPGGFEGKKGMVFSMIFQVKENILAKNGKVTIKNAKTFLNNGTGTAINIPSASFSFSLMEGKKENKEELLEDNNPPEDFTPSVARSPNIFNNQWFVVFTVQDKESGIDHYEILENDQKYDINYISSAEGIEWTKVKSPYLLKDQNLGNYIYVKAVDKAGNIRVAVVSPEKKFLKQFSDYKFLAIIIILSIIAIAIFISKRKNNLK
jgi:hypothetical protein